MSCEHCWGVAVASGEEYRTVLTRAENQGWACTKMDLHGARLRAGQFWNDATQSDVRVNPPAAPVSSEPSEDAR